MKKILIYVLSFTLILTNLLNFGTSLTVAKAADFSIEENLLESNLILERDSELGEVYYVLDDNGVQKRTVMDFLDIAMAGLSWYELITDVSLKNLGWALLDTAAIAPLIPSSGYFRQGTKYGIKTSAIKNLAKTTSGKAAIRRALTTVASSSLSTSKLTTALKLGRIHKLNQAQYVNHIVKNHGPYSTMLNKSKFLKSFDIKVGITSTVRDSTKILQNTEGRPGYIYIKKFSQQVGVDPNGKKLYQVKVVLDSAGVVITAYPY